MTDPDGSPPAEEATTPTPADGGWVGVVANPASGAGVGRLKAEALAAALKARGFIVETAWTPADRAALVARANADPERRRLVAVGGDGTVSALINERPEAPITILPTGTENLAAHHFQLDGDPEHLAGIVAAGKSAAVDLGVANGRRFLLMVGFGFDGDVVTRHHGLRTASGSVRPTHRGAYVEPILRSSVCYRFPKIAARIEDAGAEETLIGTTVFVFNLPRYALNLPFAPHARQDDGLLDLVVFRDPGPFHALYYLWRVLLGSHLKLSGVFHRRARRIALSSRGIVPVQIDGDPGGLLLPLGGAAEADPALATTRDRWTVEVLPGALRVLVDPSWSPEPASPPADLAARGPFG